MKRVRLMPNPVKRDNGTYYLFVTVPADIASEAKGSLVTIPIGDRTTTTKVGTHAKASLRTKDHVEARRRFPAALAAVEAHWDSLRQGPVELNHKQSLAIAGEVRQLMIDVFDDNPREPEMWERVLKQDSLAQRGLVNELQVDVHNATQRLSTLEGRFGRMVDAALRRHSLSVTAASRAKVLELTARALSEAATVNMAKANYDYSDTGETTRYPAYERPKNRQPQKVTTLTDILDRRIEDRAQGKDAKAFGESAVRKMRLLIAEFDDFRDDIDVRTINPETVDGWRRAMQATALLSNNTIKQRLQNLATIIQYGMRQSYGSLFPKGNPAASGVIERPEAVTTPSAELTYQLDEARAVLRATRTQATFEETRWLPWLCAYSGARVGEVEQLTVGDVFQVEGHWFMRLTTMGRKTLKNKHGERRVPIHRDVIKEGFIDFAVRKREEGCVYLFDPKQGQRRVRVWVRDGVGVSRPELQPIHGWRHLFEDWAMRSGMSGGACLYVTGRTTGKSQEGYGKSEAMLPGLAREMEKLQSFLAEG